MSEQAELTNMKMVVQEPFEEYDVNRDFMSLDAWKKAREVKLFFYKYELKDHLISCYDFEYISKELFEERINLIETAKKTLNGYINFVKKQMK